MYRLSYLADFQDSFRDHLCGRAPSPPAAFCYAQSSPRCLFHASLPYPRTSCSRPLRAATLWTRRICDDGSVKKNIYKNIMPFLINSHLAY